MNMPTPGLNRILQLSAIAATIQMGVTNCAVADTSCASAPAGMVGWWPLNGDWADVVGGNAGVPAGNPEFAAGAVGQAMVFDGVSNHVRLPATAALDVGAGNGLTIEMWIKPADVSVEQQLAEWNNGTGFIGAHFSLAINALGGGPGSLWCNLTDAGSGDHKLSTAQGLVVPNVYQHVALTYDKASGLATIYLNGNVAAQANLGSFTPYTSSDLYLGTRPTGAHAGLRYRGGMDEVSVYGRALSAGEIQAIYNAGSAGKCPHSNPTCVTPSQDLVGWWPGQGNANDIIGGRHGVLYNGTGFNTGTVGQAFSFDGIDDAITNAVGGIKSVTNSFTMEFWARPDAARNSTPETYSGIYGTGGQRYAIYPDFGDLGPVGAGVSVGTNGISVFEHGYAYLSSLLVYDAPITGWTHIAVVYTNRQPLLYVNGVFVRAGLVSTRIPYPSTYFGEAGINTGNYGHYSGLLDEVSIYDRSLLGAEVLAIYNAGGAGKCPPSPPTCVTPSQDLVGWWPLNGDWADVVGGNTGVPAGNPAFAAGAVGQAMVFDGVSNHVRLPATTALNVGAGNGLTIEMWIKPADASVEQQLAEWNNGAGRIGAHFSLSVPALGGGPGSLWCNLEDSGGGDHQLSTAPGLVTANAYQHVALTYDKATGVAKIYVNGGVAAQANFGSFTADTSSDLYLGTRPSGEYAGLRYRGGMDEVSVYGRALSAGEIHAIYNAGSAGKCPPSANQPPVADASATQRTYVSCNGSNSVVKLDGSHSSDPDGDPLNYAWYQQGSAALLATGVAPSVVLSVGEHLIGLVVSDGFASRTNTIMVTVLTSEQAIECLIADVESRAARPKPLLVSLDAALAAILRGAWTAANNELLAFQFKVSVQVAPVDDALAEEFLQSARQISDAVVCAGAKPHPRGRVQSVTRTADGNTQIEFVGSVVSTYFVQASTNLVDWQTIGEATAQADGTFQFVDSESDRHAARFYRVFAP